MPQGPENSAIKLSPSQEKEVSQMLPDAMREYFRTLAVEQGLATRDIYSPDVLIESPQPKGVAKSVTVDGTKYVLEAATEEELVQVETEFYRQLFGGKSAETEPVDQPRDEQGRFVSQVQDDGTAVANEADARIKMMRGEISVEDYIRTTGALDSYLKEKFGLDPAKVADERFVDSWAHAATEFLAGSDWPGGKNNMKRLQEILYANNLQDSPSAETLTKVYEFMRENNLVQENPEIEAQRRIAGATSPEEIRSMAHFAVGIPENPESIYNFKWK